MKCPMCGAQNKNGTMFCKMCGNDLTVQPETETGTELPISPNPAGKPPVGMIIAVAGAAAALIAVIVLILVLMLNRNPTPDTTPVEATAASTEASTAAPTTEPTTEATTSNVVAVPNVVGMKSTDAYNTITREGLKYKVEFEYNDRIPEDYIVSQSPSDSKNAALGDTISLIASRGSKPAVPVAPAPESSQSSQSSRASSSSVNTSSDTKDRYNLRASSRYLSRSDITFLNLDGIQHAINEMYAVHGYRFTKGDEKTYFESMSWYHPDTQDMNLVVSRMNNYEKENLKVMGAYRDSLR